MDIVTIEPQNNLKQVVKKIWYANVQNSQYKNKTYNILADGALGIIFQHYNGQSSLLNAKGHRLPVSFVYGQKSDSPCINSFQGSPFIFGVNFQPTAFKKLFSINTSELTNTLIDGEHLFPKQFIEKLLHTSSPKQITQLFSEQLYPKLQKSKQDKLIDHSIKLIFDDTKGINSYRLSSLFPVSRRQFQRRFKEHLGVCPETYMRIIKFQKSIYLLRTGQYSKLSDIGFLLNYADQSHFGREFKLFSGYTPKEFLLKNWQSSFQINPSIPFETMRIVSNG